MTDLEKSDLEKLQAAKDLYFKSWRSPDNWEQNIFLVETILQKILDKEPDNTIALTNLGAVLSDQGKHLEALEYLEKADEVGSEDKNFYLNMGIVLMNIPERMGDAKNYFLKSQNFRSHDLTFEAYFDAQAY